MRVDEIPLELRESVIISLHKKSDRTDPNNNCSNLLLTSAYKILSNIVLARLTSYANQTMVDYQCGLMYNRISYLLSNFLY